VQAHPNADQRVTGGRGHGTLDGHCAFQLAAGTAEGQHEAVALALDLEAAVRLHLLSDQGMMGPQQLQPALISQAQSEVRGAFDIGEEQRDGAIRGGVRAEIGGARTQQ
jgi:hypothetical protein